MQREVAQQARYGITAARQIEKASDRMNAPEPTPPDRVVNATSIDHTDESALDEIDVHMDDLEAWYSVRREAGALFWYAIQNLLVSTANVSKLLWGTGGRRAEERRPLRESLDVPDDSPLAETKMRNNFEHIDERLEQWNRESPHHIYVDFIIGPSGRIISGDAVGPIDQFRIYDPEINVLTFWGDSFHASEIVNALAEVMPIAEKESQKAHWEE